MIIPAICFIGGLVAMGRTKAQTNVRKLLCLGPRSGFVYQVEDFPEVGTVVVRAPTKTAVVQFLRASVREPGKAGLIFMNASGDPRLVEIIRRDFGMEPQKLVAVPNAGAAAPGKAPAQRSMSAAAAALSETQRALYWSSLVYKAPEQLTADQKRIVDAMTGESHPNNPAFVPNPAAPAAQPTAQPAAKSAQTGRSTP